VVNRLKLKKWKQDNNAGIKRGARLPIGFLGFCEKEVQKRVDKK